MMHLEQGEVVGGVDTHRDFHVAAVIDPVGRILATRSFPSHARGCTDLETWLCSFGSLAAVGVEGTGSYGVCLARSLNAVGVLVLEVNRPDRQRRRRHGKSDSTDAEAAGRAVLNGDATAIPKRANGPVESLRMLQLARVSAVKAQTQAVLQIRDVIVNAPASLREELHGLPLRKVVETAAKFRPNDTDEPLNTAKRVL